MRRRAVLAAMPLVPAALVAVPAQAAEVDLVLVLAVDASGSVSQERFELQRQGYAHAFRHPRLLQAIRSGARGGIAVSMTQWTGPAMQLQVVPWHEVRDAAGAEAFAAGVDDASRQLFGGGTSINGAINHAAGLIAMAPFTAARRVIDVSGDGANNRGRPAEEARDGAVSAGITINGLPILAVEPHLDAYYRDNVIGGLGAFMIVAEDYEQFSEAILRKLILEIADLSAPYMTQRRA